MNCFPTKVQPNFAPLDRPAAADGNGECQPFGAAPMVSDAGSKVPYTIRLHTADQEVIRTFGYEVEYIGAVRCISRGEGNLWTLHTTAEAWPAHRERIERIAHDCRHPPGKPARQCEVVLPPLALWHAPVIEEIVSDEAREILERHREDLPTEPETTVEPPPTPAESPRPRPLAMLDFLTRILAGSGIRCGVILDPKTKKPTQRFFKTNAELERWLRANMNQGDAYHANATFKTNQNRKKVNAHSYKAAWVDCDLKFDAALAAAAAFFKSSGVPLPSIIIASGGGCHLYWVFTGDITLDEWEHAAGLLEQACAANRFEIDSKCTIAVRGWADVLEPAVTIPRDVMSHDIDRGQLLGATTSPSAGAPRRRSITTMILSRRSKASSWGRTTFLESSCSGSKPQQAGGIHLHRPAPTAAPRSRAATATTLTLPRFTRNTMARPRTLS